MSHIARILPETIDMRQEALSLAKNKLDSLPAGTNPLTAATTTRLNATVTDFLAKVQAVATAAFAYNGNTVLKESTQATCLMFTSHFIQVFNLGVKRGVYTAAQRDFFNLPIGSDALPDMVKASDLLMWCTRLVDGDALRITAGGAAMSNPTTAQLDTTLTAFTNAFNAHSNFKDALDLAQEALEGILDEADKVIKKVWDELETFYNEESDESRRDNCREWGVVYVTVGSEKAMSGTVTYNGAPGAGLVVKFKTGKNKSTVSGTGGYSLNTTLMGTQAVLVLKYNEDNVEVKRWEFEVTLNENGDKTQNFVVND